MSDDRHQTRNCLDAETLATFIDGRLEPREREAVEAHLAECEDCYEVWMEGRRAQSPEPQATFGTRRTWLGRMLIPLTGVAAAGLLAVAGLSYWNASRSIEARTAVALSGPGRVGPGRLSGDAEWRPLAGPTRGGQDEAAASAEARIAISEIEIALRDDRSWRMLWAYAKTRMALQRVDEAIEALEEARTMASEPALLSDLALAYLQRATLTGEKVSLPAALDVISQVTAADAPPIEAWFNKALLCEQLGRVECARDAWDRYLRADPHSKWADEAREHLARLLEKESRPPGTDAGALLDELLDKELPRVVQALGSGAAPTTLWSAATSLVDRISAASPDPYARAVLTHLQAAEFSSANNPLKRGIALWAEGRAAIRNRDLARAAVVLEPAAAALQRSGSPLVMSAKLYLGVVAERRQHNRVAAQILVPLKAAATHNGYLAIAGRADWTLGLIHLADGRLVESAASYESAYARLHQAAELSNAASVTGLLATNFDSQGDIRQTWQFRVTSLQNSRRATVFLRASAEASRSHWHHAAVEFADTALAISQASNDPIGVASALRRLARANGRLGRTRVARAQLIEARQIVPTLASAEQTRIGVELDLAEADVLATVDPGQAVESALRAIRHFESADPPAEERLPEIRLHLAQALTTQGRRMEAIAALTAGLDSYHRIRRKLPLGTVRTELATVARDLTDRLVEQSTDTPEAGLRAIEALRAWDLQHANDSATDGLENLPGRLPAGATILSYFVSTTASKFWAITSDDVKVFEVPKGRSELAALVQSMKRRHSREAARQQLTQLLIEPARGLLADTRLLVVVPDGPLHDLPFAALRGLQSEYLIEERPVLVGVGLSHLFAPRTLPMTDGLILAVGNPAFDAAQWPGLTSLAQASREATRVAELGRSRLIDGDEAHASKVVPALTEASVFHFAGHSIDNPLEADMSSLVLAGQDRLTAGEIRALPLGRLQLVVLSSCRSLTGPRLATDGPLGLARAFLAAGAAHVIATSARVADGPTRDFIEVFYDHFVDHHNAVTALQAAQRWAIGASTPEIDTFEHWSSFSAIGVLQFSTLSPPSQPQRIIA